MRKRELKQRLALRHVFDQAARHFRMSVAAKAIAWEAAIGDREKAFRCYAAIARSLAPR